ncbi:hypothetical protein O181_116979 [Austropuccinia psidii MF-1]|uniref:Uncharacterized protein n=1 Tax=Austropuccinia psidii MF-1 TaxID=1389203 RepID=A0A9Q3PX26_9BASI|nr:hypothetical protein [Austropuccinia psidii MF-1]
MFKKLGFEANELEGLMAQTACHPPSTLDRMAFDELFMAAILAKGNEKPFSTFVGQVIFNVSQKNSKPTRQSSPFMYCVSDLPGSSPLYPHPCSPHFPKPTASTSNIRCPPDHLVNKFGGSCFHCRCTGHWWANCPQTKGVANPNLCPPSPGHYRAARPGTPDC